MSRRRHALLGLALAVASAALALWSARGLATPALSIEVHERPLFSAAAAVSLSVHGADETSLASTPRGVFPERARGLVRHRASVRYGARAPIHLDVPQLVGPFQDPGSPSCGIRVTVPPAFLDASLAEGPPPPTAAGAAGAAPAPPLTVAELTRTLLAEELVGQRFWPLGEVLEIQPVSLELGGPALGAERLRPLARRAAARAQATLDAGFLGIYVTIVLDRARVPLRVVVLPQQRQRELEFVLELDASIDFDNRLLNWIADLAGADKRATTAIRRALDGLLGPLIAPPPALELGAGLLALGFCHHDPVLIDPARGLAVRFAVPIAVGPRAQAPPALDGDLPRLPSFASTTSTPGEQAMPVVELNLDALNGLLFALWRGEALDAALAEEGIAARFNEHELVTSLLSLRIGALHLELPPVLTRGAAPNSLALALAATATLHDDATTTLGHVFASASLTPAPAAPGETQTPALRIDLDEASLACERRAGAWSPCYGLIMTALLDNAGAINSAISAALSSWLTELFIGQRLIVSPHAPSVRIESAQLEIASEPAAAAAPRASGTTLAAPQTVVRLRLRSRLEGSSPAP